MAAESWSAGPGVRRLGSLLHGFATVDPGEDLDIGGLALDSRRVMPGDLFLASPGGQVSGAGFIDQALAAGAIAVVCDAADPAAPKDAALSGQAVPLIAIEGLNGRLGEIAARFHGEPSRALKVIGITGTNGKTSCAHYLARALAAGGDRCGVIGTLGHGEFGALVRDDHTTPDALTLQAELAGFRDAGIGHVIMEVSSHALAQQRTAGIAFDTAVFTNLSHDHLDYHGDLGAYGTAKRQLFHSPGLRHAVVNRDDAFGRSLIDGLDHGVQCLAYGIGASGPQVRQSRYVDAINCEFTPAGITLDVRTREGDGRLEAPLLGRFNAYNLLASVAALLSMDMPLAQALQRLSAVRPVSGRMERFGGEHGQPLVIVDYAHTPDALEQALTALRSHRDGRLWCVFGCGGDRDREKRPSMGAIAERLADHVILTSDNPRGEAPDAIVAEIRTGFERPASARVVVDRASAIRTAITDAASGDVVLVAGKGHEDYQIIGHERVPFSDQAVVAAVLAERVS